MMVKGELRTAVHVWRARLFFISGAVCFLSFFLRWLFGFSLCRFYACVFASALEKLIWKMLVNDTHASFGLCAGSRHAWQCRSISREFVTANAIRCVRQWTFWNGLVRWSFELRMYLDALGKNCKSSIVNAQTQMEISILQLSLEHLIIWLNDTHAQNTHAHALSMYCRAIERCPSEFACVWVHVCVQSPRRGCAIQRGCSFLWNDRINNGRVHSMNSHSIRCIEATVCMRQSESDSH